jgi:hypothetical protein
MAWASSDLQRDNLLKKMAETEEIIKENEEKITDLETELFKVKSKLGDVINAAFEFGGSELMDKIEKILTKDN